MFPSQPGCAVGAVIAERFTVLEAAGSGGAGAVYRARDASTGTDVALKILLGVSADHRERFRREAAVLAGLDHPAIVRYVAHGDSEVGPYLAMAWLEGPDLRSRLSGGPIGIEEGLRLGYVLAGALDAAHAAGVVHRDVKPANIILIDGRLDRPCLVDFGSARIDTVDVALTQTGALVGTPAYMAPEQARGERADLDPRVDVFALGCLLWECLAGRRAFEGRSPFEVLAAVLEHDPPPVLTLRPEAPGPLSRLLSQMLAKDPQRRPADGAVVRLALGVLLATGEPTATTEIVVRRAILAAPAPLVWALLADTNRWDRLSGAATTDYAVDASGARIGQAAIAGVPSSWSEIGEWVEGRWGWGERRFSHGLFAALDYHFRCEPRDEGGTAVEVEGWATPAPGTPQAAAWAMAAHFGERLERYLEHLARLVAVADLSTVSLRPGDSPFLAARRLVANCDDRWLTGPTSPTDEFELTRRAAGFDAPLEADLVALLRSGPDDVVRQMRPRFLARLWDAECSPVLDLLAAATQRGLVDLELQLICPVCRVASQVVAGLESLASQGGCETCRHGFALDLADNVEVVFSIAPSVRQVAAAVWCAGSPAFRPHVLASLRVAPGATRELDLEHLDQPVVLRCGRSQELALPSWRGAVVDVTGAPEVVGEHRGAGLLLHNTGEATQVVTIERVGESEEVTTLAEVLSVPYFAALFRASAGSAGAGAVGVGVLSGGWVVAQPTGLLALCRSLGDASACLALRDTLTVAASRAREFGATPLLGNASLVVWCREVTHAQAVAAALNSLGGNSLALRTATTSGSVFLARGPAGPEPFGAVLEEAKQLASSNG